MPPAVGRRGLKRQQATKEADGEAAGSRGWQSRSLPEGSLPSLARRGLTLQRRLRGFSQFCSGTQGARAGWMGARAPLAGPGRRGAAALSALLRASAGWPAALLPGSPSAYAGLPTPPFVAPPSLNSCSVFTVHTVIHLSVCYMSPQLNYKTHKQPYALFFLSFLFFRL